MAAPLRNPTGLSARAPRFDPPPRGRGFPLSDSPVVHSAGARRGGAAARPSNRRALPPAASRRQHGAVGRGRVAAVPLAARRRRCRRARRGAGAARRGGRAGAARLQPVLLAPAADGAGGVAADDRGAARLLAGGLSAARAVPQGQGAGALGAAGAGGAVRGAGAGAGGLQQAPARHRAPAHLARPRRAADRAVLRRAEPGRAAAALPQAGGRLDAGQAAAVPRHGRAGGLPAGLRQPDAGHVLAVVHHRSPGRRLVPGRAVPRAHQPGGDEPGEQRLPVPQAEPALSAARDALQLLRPGRTVVAAGTRHSSGDTAGPQRREWECRGLPLHPPSFPSTHKSPCHGANGGKVTAGRAPGGVLQPAGSWFIPLSAENGTNAGETSADACVGAHPQQSGGSSDPGRNHSSSPPAAATFPAPMERGSVDHVAMAPGLLPIVLLAGPESWEQHPSGGSPLYPELLFNKDSGSYSAVQPPYCPGGFWPRIGKGTLWSHREVAVNSSDHRQVIGSGLWHHEPAQHPSTEQPPALGRNPPFMQFHTPPSCSSIPPHHAVPYPPITQLHTPPCSAGT